MCHHYVTSLKVMWHHIKVSTYLWLYVYIVMYIVYIITYKIHIHDLYEFEPKNFNMETSQCFCHQTTQPFVNKSRKVYNSWLYLLKYKTIMKSQNDTTITWKWTKEFKSVRTQDLQNTRAQKCHKMNKLK
jgi:hypothetical protein